MDTDRDWLRVNSMMSKGLHSVGHSVVLLCTESIVDDAMRCERNARILGLQREKVIVVMLKCLFSCCRNVE